MVRRMDLRTTSTLIASLTLLSLPVACSRSAPRPQSATPPGVSTAAATTPSDDPRCPTALAGVRVEQEEVEGGESLRFTTSEPAELEELRRRVASYARELRQGHRGHTGAMTTGAGTAGAMGPMPSAQIELEAIDRGARIVLRPNEPTERDALRAHVDLEARALSTGRCPGQAIGGGPSPSEPVEEPWPQEDLPRPDGMKSHGWPGSSGGPSGEGGPSSPGGASPERP
jgi:hypothetical protein